MTRKCVGCGTEIPEDGVKCPMCGAPYKSLATVIPPKQDEERERIVWEGKPEWKAYLFIALLIVPTIATIIIPIIIIAYILLDRASAEFKVSTKRIMCKYGVLSRRTCELEINDIRSINVSQSFLQRIIGVGNIEFTTAAGPIKEAIIMKIDRPDQLKEQIRSLKK